MASIPTQEEILAATRKSQEAMIATIRNWFETARTAGASVYAPLTDKLPRLPSVSLPFADKLPTPQEAVASAYDTAEQLLASQRRFTEELLKAMTPLMPGHGQGRAAWQEAVTTSEPKPVAGQAAPRAEQTTAGSASKSASGPSARKSTAGSARTGSVRTGSARTGSAGTATESVRKSTAAKTAPKPAARKPTAAQPAETKPAEANGAPKGTEAS